MSITSTSNMSITTDSSFDTLWSLLETDKNEFVKRMQLEQKTHDEQMKANIWGHGNLEYTLMQRVWTEFHKNGGKREVQPPPTLNPYAGQFWMPQTTPSNPGSAQPALTQTTPTPQVVQWVQGNRIIMRPEDRLVSPGEGMTNVRIVR